MASRLPRAPASVAPFRLRGIAHRQVELARRGLALARGKLEVERAKLARGLASNFQVVSFEDALVRAANTEVDAVFLCLDALLGVGEALGRVRERWGVDVARIVP